MKTKSRNSDLPGLILMALLIIALLAACSGGNIEVSVDGGKVPPVPPFQNSEPVTAHGTITGLNSLTVNGVRYSTDGASVLIDAEPGLPGDLRHGHVVTITGRLGTGWFAGTATTVRMDSLAVGPLETIDAGNGRLLVMGQPVRLGTDTFFAGGINPDTLAGLAAGDIVRISGYADAAGAIRATRVEPAAANARFHVIGEVAALDIGALSFDINQLGADYSNALLIDLPGGAPANGMRVRAIGSLSNGVLRVEQLVAAPVISGSSGRRAQVAGIVTRYASMGDFEVDGAAISANQSTWFSNGTSADLGLNAEVTIDGDFNSGGRIRADRVIFGQLASATSSLVYDVSGFTEISVPTVFGITVTQGADYAVEVVVDTGAADRVDVTKIGSRLTIGLLSGNGQIDTLEARVTMPVLERIDLTGVVNARLHDFDQPRMTINVGNVSNLRGDGLRLGELHAAVTGVSRLDLADIRPLGLADIAVSGVSQATLNMDVGATLSGSISTGQGTGSSVLYYYGTNVNLDVAAGSNTSIIRLGDTRP